MVTGKRKTFMFTVTMIAIVVVFMTALIIGVSFTGDNIIAAIGIIGVVGGVFAGANVGEHFADKKPKVNQ